MMFDEYVFLVMETQQSHQDELDLQQAVRKFLKNDGMLHSHIHIGMPYCIPIKISYFEIIILIDLRNMS